MEKYNIKKIEIKNKKKEKGQSLIEVLIAVSVGAILIAAAATTIIPIIRSNFEARTVQTAGSLGQEYLDNLQSIAGANWHNIYNPPALKGPGSQFHLTALGAAFVISSGSTSTIIEGRSYNRFFSIENVNRNSCGIGDITVNATTTCLSGPGTTGVSNDPSTQKITVTINWEAGRSITKTQYLVRSQNKVFVQSDWSGGSGQIGPIISENNRFTTSTNINHSTTTGSIIIQF